MAEMALYLALVHYPTYNRHGEIVGTCITPLDMHDLGRIGLTYGIKCLYLTNPFESQKALIREVIHHWVEGVGGEYRPHRRKAVGIVKLSDSLSDICEDIVASEGVGPFVVATTAKWDGETVEAGSIFEAASGKSVLLVFGTGYGLTEDVLMAADAVLGPIRGAGNFYHLPVRSAVAIYVDRIFSKS